MAVRRGFVAIRHVLGAIHLALSAIYLVLSAIYLVLSAIYLVLSAIYLVLSAIYLILSAIYHLLLSKRTKNPHRSIRALRSKCRRLYIYLLIICLFLIYLIKQINSNNLLLNPHLYPHSK